MIRNEEYERFKWLVRETDQAITYFKSLFEEAMKKGDQNQIVYYQGCVDSLQWLKKDHGFGKRKF